MKKQLQRRWAFRQLTQIPRESYSVFIILDGDDIGRKITSCCISNNEFKLAAISREMNEAVVSIGRMLGELGFRIIFCAADGVVAARDLEFNANEVFNQVRLLAPEGVTFSAGVGQDLQQAYLALTQAKCSGKNKLLTYEQVGKNAS